MNPGKENNNLYLGQIYWSDDEAGVSLCQKDRRRHIYVIGQTGSGKTTFLKNCILQDIYSGAVAGWASEAPSEKRGLCIIDPHGDLAEELIDSIPKSRTRDVVYVNPSDINYPIGINPLRGVPEELQAVAVANLVASFRSIWASSWGPRLEHILSNTLAALMAYPSHMGISLLAVAPMLTDATFRRNILRHVKDPVVRDFWLLEFAGYNARQRAEFTAPILNKIGAFMRSPVMRNILGQAKNGFNLSDIMDNRKILIVNLSKGLLGEDMSNLLGSLLVCQIQQAAMARASIPEEDRVDFHLYIDEFQNFTTDSLESILSEARKYKISMVCANQYLSQIKPNIRSALLGNVGNLCMFALSGQDAEQLKKELPPKTDIDLLETSRGQMVGLLLEDGQKMKPEKLLVPLMEERRGSRDRVINHSRTNFAKDRAKVEEKLFRWMRG